MPEATCRSTVGEVILSCKLEVGGATLLLGRHGALTTSLAGALARGLAHRLIPEPRGAVDVRCEGRREYNVAIWVGAERLLLAYYELARTYDLLGRLVRGLTRLEEGKRYLEAIAVSLGVDADSLADLALLAVEKLGQLIQQAGAPGLAELAMETTAGKLTQPALLKKAAEAMERVEAIIRDASASIGVRAQEALPYRLAASVRGERGKLTELRLEVRVVDERTGALLEPSKAGLGVSAAVLIAAAELGAALAGEGKRVLLAVDSPELGLTGEAQYIVGYLLGALPSLGVDTVVATHSSPAARGLLEGAKARKVQVRAYVLEPRVVEGKLRVEVRAWEPSESVPGSVKLKP